MKKNRVIIGVVVIALLAGGGMYFLNQNKTGTTTVPGTSQQANTAGGSVFTSIKDALSRSMTLECSFTDDEGKQTKSYMKNGAVRADMASSKPEEAGSMIMKDKKIYFWNAQKQGFMMEIPDEANVTPGAAPNSVSEQQEDLLEDMEKYKENCKPGVVADSLFTPPTDITFTDYSKLMVPPPGMKTDQPMNQKQAEEYMKQFAPETNPEE